MGSNIKRTTLQFIDRAKIVHKNIYDYSKVEYVNYQTNVIIICNKHGKFLQSPSNHLFGKGCKLCGNERTGLINSKRYLDKCGFDFVKKAKIKHNNFYNYSKVAYKGTLDKVEIECPLHGYYQQKPSHHLRGSGCPKCATNISSTRWDNLTKKRKVTVYFLKIYNETEIFYKIGITSTNIFKRFQGNLPYSYEIINFKVFQNPLLAFELEKRFKSIFRKRIYKPLNFFRGHTECFKHKKT